MPTDKKIAIKKFFKSCETVEYGVVSSDFTNSIVSVYFVSVCMYVAHGFIPDGGGIHRNLENRILFYLSCSAPFFSVCPSNSILLHNCLKISDVVNFSFFSPQVDGGNICVESFNDFPQMGRFTLRDEGKTIAIGKILKVLDSVNASGATD